MTAMVQKGAEPCSENAELSIQGEEGSFQGLLLRHSLLLLPCPMIEARLSEAQ
jgi:hypothetical protein